MENYEVHPCTRTVGPRIQAWTGSQRASHFSLESMSVYVAMLISVTKASMYLCRDRRRCTDQSGAIYK